MQSFQNKLTVLFLTLSLSVFSQSFLNFTSPNSGEVIEVSTSQLIKWKSTNVNQVNLEYCESYNTYPNPNEWVKIASNLNASSGYYLWNTPDTLTSVRLRIVDSSNPLVYDLADGNINFWNPITSPKNIKLLAPNGGEILNANSEYLNISVKVSNIAYVGFEYSIDNGQNWIAIDSLEFNKSMIASFPAFCQVFNWKIPNVNSSLCKLRTFDINSKSIIDESDGVFSIQNSPPKTIEVVSPNSATSYPINQNQKITWNSTGVSNVKIEYAENHSFAYDVNEYNWITITNSTPATPNEYEWLVPANIIATRLRISDSNSSSIYDISDMNFSTYDPITNPPIPLEVELTSLIGGEVLKQNTEYFNISWKYQGNYSKGDLNIQFTSNNGQNWIDIAE